MAIAAVAGTALAMTLTACSAGEAESTRKEALVPQLAITPGDGAANVAPGARIVVRAKNGTVRAVRVQTGGDPVTGRLSDHGTAWQSLSPLNASRRFTVVATAIGSGGKTVTATSSFATVQPRKVFNAMTLEGYQQHYGVGMPIILNFSRPITRKAAIEKAIRIRTSKRVVGAWYWDGDKTLYFRPRTYWPQHTRVSFDARFNGVQGAPGVYGTHDLTQSFEISSSLMAVASNKGNSKVTKTRSCCGGHWAGWLDHCLHRLWTHQELCQAAAERAASGCKHGSGVDSRLDAALLPRGGRWRPVCAA
jgi:Bacterial Ig domain